MCNPNNCDLKIGSAIQFPLRSAQDCARPRHNAPRVLRRLVRQGFLFIRDGSSFVAIAIAIAIAIDIDSGIVQAEMAMAKATKLEPSCRDCHCHCHWDFLDNPNVNGNGNGNDNKTIYLSASYRPISPVTTARHQAEAGEMSPAAGGDNPG